MKLAFTLFGVDVTLIDTTIPVFETPETQAMLDRYDELSLTENPTDEQIAEWGQLLDKLQPLGEDED